MDRERTAEHARLLSGYRRFRNGGYKQASALYRELGEGQDPDILIIACADSRADPALIFDAAPGEFFVIRNVAALVPPYDESGGYHGVSAAVEFAVNFLKVKQILVMGHASCGGVKASLSAAGNEPVGQFIGPWVQLADEARDKVLADETCKTPDARQHALELGVVEQSMDNLMTFPFIRDAVNAGEVALDGAWFSIAGGELYTRSRRTGEFFLVNPEA